MRRILLALALAAAPAVAEAGPGPRGGAPRAGRDPRVALAELRAVGIAAAKRDGWRATLRRRGVTLDARAPLFHPIPDPVHREGWRRELARARGVSGRTAVVRRWMAAGRLAGLWTTAGDAGWYARDGGGDPIELRLRPDMVLYDADLADHAEVYAAWIADQEASGAGPDPFDDARGGPRGLSLAERARAIRAPRHEKFYRDLGVAGVTWVDHDGRKNVVLLNADAVAEIRFPAAPPGS